MKSVSMDKDASYVVLMDTETMEQVFIPLPLTWHTVSDECWCKPDLFVASPDAEGKIYGVAKHYSRN